MKKILLLLILATGLALRLIGADWGFPLLLHPDEHIVADVPADMAARSSFDPGVYDHPDHLEIYANAGIFHIVSLIRYGKPLTETFKTHTTFYYLLARIFIALLGTACILVAYLIGKEYGEGTAMVAALLFAVFPSYVGHSHFITPDVPLTLCVLCVMLFAVKYLKNPTNTTLILMSLASACAVSVKYPGLLTVALTMTVMVRSHYPDKKKMILELSKACVLFLVFAFLLSPYLFINYPKVILALLDESRATHLGADGLGWAGNLLYYVQAYVSFSGFVMFLLCFIGAYTIVKAEKWHAVPLFFGFFYWLLLSKVPLHWERWALPMYTAPLLLTAYGIDAAYKKTLIEARSCFAPTFGAAVSLLFLRLLILSAEVTLTFTLKDTRNVSSEFVRHMDINDVNTLHEGYTPLCPGRGHSVSFGSHREEDSKNIKYIMVSSYMYDRYRNERSRYAPENKFYDYVFTLPLVKQFTPIPEEDFTTVSFWTKEDLMEAVTFLRKYWRNKDELLSGPTIRIHQVRS